MVEKNETSDVPGDLWVVASKMRGLGELFNMCVGDPPLSDGGIKGLSYLLIELADEVEGVHNLIEDNAQKSKE